MLKSRLALSGFITFALLEIFSGLYALVSGRIAAMSNHPTIQQFAAFLVVMTILVGLIGAVLGLVFGWAQRRMPIMKPQYQAAIFFVTVSAVVSIFKGPRYLLSADFAITIVASAIAGFVFIWLYDRVGGRGVRN